MLSCSTTGGAVFRDVRITSSHSRAASWFSSRRAREASATNATASALETVAIFVACSSGEEHAETTSCTLHPPGVAASRVMSNEIVRSEPAENARIRLRPSAGSSS